MKLNASHIIQSVLSGIGIGFPVTLLCMTAIGGWNGVILEFVVWMAASALFGLLSGVLFFSKHDLPLPAAMGLHCLGCFAVAVGAAAIIGYAENILDLIAAIAPVFVIVYAVIYAVCFAFMKYQEKQINAALNQE